MRSPTLRVKGISSRAVSGYAERGDELVAIASGLRPDVVTLDVSMPGVSGLNALPALRAEMPAAIIVVLTTTAKQVYVDEAYCRRADAYVLKGRASTDLVPAIQGASRRNDR